MVKRGNKREEKDGEKEGIRERKRGGKEGIRERKKIGNKTGLQSFSRTCGIIYFGFQDSRGKESFRGGGGVGWGGSKS